MYYVIRSWQNFNQPLSSPALIKCKVQEYILIIYMKKFRPHTVLNFTHRLWQVNLIINPFLKTKTILYSSINSLNPFLRLAVIGFDTYSSWKYLPIHEIVLCVSNEARINENPIFCHWNLSQWTDLCFNSFEVWLL